MKPGPANQSYGLQVAQLAGVPRTVIKNAKQQLALLEQKASTNDSVQTEMQLIAEPVSVHPAIEKLEGINPDELTPKQALELLYELKKLEQF